MSPLIERTRSPEARHGARRPASTAACVEHVGDVVADPGQRAEVDLGEAQLSDRGQRLVEGEVPKADGRAAQPAVNHRHAVLVRGL